MLQVAMLGRANLSATWKSKQFRIAVCFLMDENLFALPKCIAN
jgi:hypothetical protein